MLRLSWEQYDVLEQVAARRHAAGIALALGEAWPTLTERLQERWPAFVEAAVLQGRRLGFVDPKELARYAGLWCIWGPSFDTKPAFAWAQEILADTRRGTTLRLHQLAHRTRDELRRLQAADAPRAAGAAAPLSPAQFDASMDKVEARIGPLSAARSVFAAEPTVSVVKACDLATIDMLLADPDALQEYRPGPTGWQRVAVQRKADPPQRWTRAPDEPVTLAVTSRGARQGPPARLNLRLDAMAVCDPRIHPEVAHQGAEDRLVWRGRDTARLSVAIPAGVDRVVPPGELPTAPGIGAPTPVELQTVSIASCGLRDAGAPFGPVRIDLRVHPATQWLTEITHPAWPAMHWPAQAEAAAPKPSCRLDRDGVAFDVGSWQRSWASLHGAFRQGLERLWNEWLRAVDGNEARLEIEVSPLVGQAGVTWGWKRSAADRVAMRVEGKLELIAFACDMALSAVIVDGAARATARVRCKGRSELRMTLDQLGEEATEEQSLKAVRRGWRFPFTLEVEPIAGAEAATLVAAAVPLPIVGALAGECGLRMRPDGLGQQWFFALHSEPLEIVTDSVDPLLGRSRRTRRLVPALKLVDWSAG